MFENYGSALLGFTANTLKVYPSRVPRDQTVATVRTEVTRTNGARDSVIFHMTKTPEGWKAFDVHHVRVCLTWVGIEIRGNSPTQTIPWIRPGNGLG